MKPIYLLNSPILTSFGTYNYSKIDLNIAKTYLKNAKDSISAIGHQATADFLTQILEIDVLMNRIQIEMRTGDIALVFKVKTRLEEGKILTQSELENTEIEYGLLARTS